MVRVPNHPAKKFGHRMPFPTRNDCSVAKLLFRLQPRPLCYPISGTILSAGTSNIYAVFPDIVALSYSYSASAGARRRRGNPRGRPSRARGRYDAQPARLGHHLPQADRGAFDTERTAGALVRKT